MFGILKKIFGSAQDRILNRYRKTVQEINKWDAVFTSLSDDELRHKTIELKSGLKMENY